MHIPNTGAPLATPAGPARWRSASWLYPVVLAIIALLPRTLGLADFYTIDEAYHWPERVRRFTSALQTQRWLGTDQTGHPGVTTMWLGALGRWIGRLQGVPDLGRIGGGAEYLATLRLPLAVVNGLAVVLGYLLLRRLLRPQIAALAGLLWATSPFIIAHSRLLHLDALLTSFMTLSVLSLLVATRRPGDQETRRPGERESGRPGDQETRRPGDRETGRPGDRETGRPHVSVSRVSVSGPRLWSFLASALLGGLALLTKAPSLLLLPYAGLLLFARSPRPGLWPRLRWSLGWYLPWLLIAVALVFAGWPAMWVAPQTAIADVANEIINNGGQPTDTGNYFMGQAVPVPGPLFYGVVVLLRSTPLTLLGGLALLGFGLYRLAAWRQRASTPAEQGERRTLLALLGFALYFGAVMNIEPKQFDRYLLPIWPALEILAAAGLFHGYRAGAALVGRLAARPGAAVAGRMATLALLAALQLGQLARVHPYYLGYYNPLLGGGAAAQQAILVGWGEGMEQVGAWLRARPDLGRGPVLSWIPFTLQPFVPREIPVFNLQPPRPGEFANYAVLYSRSVQRKESAAAEAWVRQYPPLFTLQKFGIVYASIHQLPRPFALPVDAVFGDGIRLRGVTQALAGSTLTITPSWGLEASQPGGAFTFVHVLGPGGQKVGQLDIPLDQGLFAQWQAGQQFDGPIPIELPRELAPGEYRVVMGVYRPGASARLPATGAARLPDAVDGPEAVLAATFSLP